MTEKRGQKIEICKTLSLVCHIKVQHADQWHHFVEVQVAVRVLCGTTAVFKFCHPLSIQYVFSTL